MSNLLARTAPRRMRAFAGAIFCSISLGSLALAQDIVIAAQEVLPQLDPVVQTRNVAYRILPNVFDTLIQIDYATNKLVPGLAVEWRRIDDVTLELELRQGVKFHDGSSLTAEDVVFSFSDVRMGDDQPGHGVFGEFLSSIASVEAIDADTIRIVTTAPDPVLEFRLAGWGSQIVSKKAFEATSGNWETWNAHPIGTGAYRVGKLVPGDKLVLEAYDQYWGGKPNVDSVTFAMVPEVSSRIAGLAAGDYDIITDVPADQIATVEANDASRIIGGTIRNHRTVTFDMDNPLIADPRIRQALSLAIDRQLIVDTIWGGRVDVTAGFQWPDFGLLYDANRNKPEYSPEKARSLLAEAGYAGQVIPYRVRNDYYPAEILTSQALVAMWNAVGVNVEMQIKENWDQVFAEPGTGMRNGSVPPLFADPISGTWRSFGNGPNGKENWSNVDFDELGKVLLHSLDVNERAEAHSKMLDIIEQTDPPVIVLHAMGQFYGVRDGVQWTPYNVSFMDLRASNLSVSE